MGGISFRFRRWFALGSAVAGLLFIAACIGDGSSRTSPDPALETTSAVARKTLIDRSDRVEVEIRFPRSMDRTSVEQALRVLLPTGVEVDYEAYWWRDARNLVVRVVDPELLGSESFRVKVDSTALDAGGVRLGEDFSRTFELGDRDIDWHVRDARTVDEISRAIALVEATGYSFDPRYASLRAFERNDAHLISMATGIPIILQVQWQDGEIVFAHMLRFAGDGYPVCHAPAGNPAAAQTIRVGVSDVGTHLADHGEKLEVCPGDPNETIGVDLLASTGMHWTELNEESVVHAVGRPAGFDSLDALFTISEFRGELPTPSSSRENGEQTAP